MKSPPKRRYFVDLCKDTSYPVLYRYFDVGSYDVFMVNLLGEVLPSCFTVGDLMNDSGYYSLREVTEQELALFL